MGTSLAVSVSGWVRGSGGRRLRRAVLFAGIVLMFVVVAAVGQTARGIRSPASQHSAARVLSPGAQPGSYTDPVGKPSAYTMFHDDELTLSSFQDTATTDGSICSFNIFPDENYNLSITGNPVCGPEIIGSDGTGYTRQLFGAPGRVLSQESDQVVIAQRSNGVNPDPAYGDVAISFLNADSGAPTFTVDDASTELAPRLAFSPSYAGSAVVTSDPLDIAVTDLDKVLDSSGLNHDEIVAAYAINPPAGSTTWSIVVKVADLTTYSADGQIPVTTLTLSHTIDTSTIGDIDALASANLLANDNLVSVTTGDFDGDQLPEIAVAAFENGTSAWVTTISYSTTLNSDGTIAGHSLTEAHSFQVTPQTLGSTTGAAFVETLDIAAADLNGDDIDELFVGTATYLPNGKKPDTNRRPYSGWYNFVALQSDSELRLASRGVLAPAQIPDVETHDDPHDAAPFAHQSSFPKVQLAAGLFTFDPTSTESAGINERQIAAAYNTVVTLSSSSQSPRTGFGIETQTLSASDDLLTITPTTAVPLDILVPYSSSFRDSPSPQFSLTAGNFVGVAAPTLPSTGMASQVVWGVAVSALAGPAPNIAVQYDVLAPGNQNDPTLQLKSAGSLPVNDDFGVVTNGFRLPAIAADLDGNSIFLGAPILISGSSMIRTDFIIEEPPKHSYYDATNLVVDTVSRYSEFNVSLTDTMGTSFQSTNTDTSDYTIGASTALSASITAYDGANVEIADAKGSIKVSFGSTAGFMANAINSKLKSRYGSRTIMFAGSTATDDYLPGEFLDIQIWRYRIYGMPGTVDPGTGDTTYPYYEVQIPGSSTTFQGGGLNLDWYQPTHENGNILSYPVTLGTGSDSSVPDDNGSYLDSNGNAKKTPLVLATDQFYDGTNSSVSLAFSTGTGTTTSASYNQTLSDSADFGVAVKAQAGSLETGFYTIKADASFHAFANASWTEASTSNKMSTAGQGITLNKSSGSSSQSYGFSPVFYITEDGTTKVAHSASVLGSNAGRSFWAGLYGAKPDPALNLPLRFCPVYSSNNILNGWMPNTGNSAKQARGIAFTEAFENPISGEYDPLAYAPTDGDKVRIVACVYNYSTAQSISNLTVQFQAVAYDSATDTESGQRTTIGQTTISTLAPLAMTPASIQWDTTGFGPAAAGGSSEYHIYVVLDPNNAIDETYDGTTGAGQNNEGFVYQSVFAASGSARGTARGPMSVRLDRDALAGAGINGRLKSKKVTARQFEPVRVRIRVSSDGDIPFQHHVLVYDGRPEDGAETIAGKLVNGIEGNDGRYVWFEWIPRTPGKHILTAKVLRHVGDPAAGDGMDVDTLKVNVKKARPISKRHL